MARFNSLFLSCILTHLLVGLGLCQPTDVATRATARTSPPNGCLVVRGSGTKSGEYGTIASAISAVKSPGCIFIYSGTYNEQFRIATNGVTLYGYTSDVSSYKNNAVTITHGLGSYDAGSLDASSTANIVGADFAAYNINFENTYGTAGQAVAVTANGMRQGYYGCQFKSYQDTLYAKSGDLYFSNCYIEGAVDYIFGDGAAWFGECTVASSGGGYVTASSRTYADDTAWYVFDHSTITAAAGASVKGKVFLGRPWRVLARVIYQYSTLTDVVQPEGWTTMAAGATPYVYFTPIQNSANIIRIFMEFQNTGDGAGTSQRKWLTASTAAVSKAQLWPENSGWYDKDF